MSGKGPLIVVEYNWVPWSKKGKKNTVQVPFACTCHLISCHALKSNAMIHAYCTVNLHNLEVLNSRSLENKNDMRLYV